MVDDKDLFKGTGRLLTEEESKRKMELMKKPSNEVWNLEYRPADYKFSNKKIELPSDNYEHYE